MKHQFPSKISILEKLDGGFLKLQSETSDHYYSQNRNITKMYFTRTENKELDSQDTPNPKDNLTLRCASDSKGPLYPFKQDIISMTSNRTKSLKLKKDWFDKGNYYAVFQPNETDDSADKERNLIDLTPGSGEDSSTPPGPTPPLPVLTAYKIGGTGGQFKRSISVFQAEPETFHGDFQLKTPPTLYDEKQCNYFDRHLARAYIGCKKIDVDNNVVPMSKNMLLSGGAEIIGASFGLLSVYVPVCHTADWFLFEGHSTEADGQIGEKASGGIEVFPHEIVQAGFYSKYKMKVLILGACYCLNNDTQKPSLDHYKKWQKVLPEGLILGYQRRIGFKSLNYVLENMTAQLNANPEWPINRIAGMWINLNKDCYENFREDIKGFSDRRPWCLAYVMPSPFTPGKSLYRYGTTSKGIGGHIKIDLNTIEF